ncbi:MAG: saccharopine dehydrogenase NADP-binding domain-containing protein [Candidatus Melainabacteria bacterium]|nr:saccharopine dehydrogenase NADP-binding domain-containing protein [Candidatus Melainabacteria bacterium]
MKTTSLDKQTLLAIATSEGKQIDPIEFNGRLVIIGCGSVSQCLQPLLLKNLKMDFSKLTIIDMEDKRDNAKEILEAGATYVQIEITKENLGSVLGELVGEGDMIIDLAWNISTIDIIDWCQDNGVLFINTSIEVWEPYMPNNGLSAADDTIYARHVAFQEFKRRRTGGDTTAIIEHGANPGLVNHWVKRGLEEVSLRILETVPMLVERRQALEAAVEARDFAKMAMLTGTKVIHISERDTQKSGLPINYKEEFVNTWSVESFHQESVSVAELAWGTHERELPEDAIVHSHGPQNKIYLERMGMQTLANSWVPSGDIVGQITAHGEVFSISDHLTVKDGDKVEYRPSVYFVYKPADQALNCLAMQESLNYELPENTRVMNDEIVSGMDEVGVLLLGHDLNGWWVGSRLDIHETRSHVTGQNATTLQVAASAMSAMAYAIRHPQSGICTADDLDYKEILAVAEPFLGPCPSVQTDWKPECIRGQERADWLLQDFLVDDEDAFFASQAV